jgi:hypothetical protein
MEGSTKDNRNRSYTSYGGNGYFILRGRWGEISARLMEKLNLKTVIFKAEVSGESLLVNGVPK